jgi:hypothetical protein
MATYVNDLRLKEIATGDEAGTWGTSTNTNLELIAEAFSFGTEAITTNADTHTTTIADGSTDPGRSIYLQYTGALDSDCTVTIGPNTVSKLWFIENATTDSGSSGPYNIIIKQGSGATVTVPNGNVKAIYSDGAGSGGKMVDAFTDLHVNGLISEVTGNDNALTVISTDADSSFGPKIVFKRESSSPADDDLLGRINFDGFNDASAGKTYGRIQTTIRDASDGTEDGELTLSTIVAGTNRSRAKFGATETVFNEASVDLDFRVETDTDANALFVQGSTNRVMLGFNAQVAVAAINPHFGVVGTDNGSTSIGLVRYSDDTGGPRLVLSKSRNGSITTAGGTIVGSNDTTGMIMFSADDGSDMATRTARIQSQVSGTPGSDDMPGHLQFFTTADGASSETERMRITSGGDLLYNTTTDYGGKVNIKSDEAGSSQSTLALVSTLASNADGPILDLNRQTASPADNDNTGLIRFKSTNDAAETVAYAEIDTFTQDVTDGTEDGMIRIRTILAGTLRSRIEFDQTETVINEDSVDLDFRVESNGSTKKFFVDGGENVVCINTDSPRGIASTSNRQFQMEGTSGVGSSFSITRNQGSSGGPGIFFGKTRGSAVGDNTIAQDGDALGTIGFAAADGTNVEHQSAKIDSLVDGTPGENDVPGNLRFHTTPDGSTTLNERMRIDESGNLHYNTTTDFGGKVNIARADNNTTLALVCTDNDASDGPILDFIRDSASPATTDDIAHIKFKANDSDGNRDTFANIEVFSTGVTSGNESATIQIRSLVGGTELQRLKFSSTEATFNEEGADLDFRVESNAKTHMFYVDATNDKIGVNTNTPGCSSGGIHLVHDASEGTPSFTGGDVGIFQRNFNSAQGAGVAIVGGTASVSVIKLGDKDDVDIGKVSYDHSDDSLQFTTGAAEIGRFTTDALLVGTTTPVTNFSSTAQFVAHQAGDEVCAKFICHQGTVTSADQPIIEVSFQDDTGLGNGSRFMIFTDENSTVGTIQSASTTSLEFGTGSDERLKENIVDAPSQLDKILDLDVRQFDWKKSGETEIGFVAQEVKKVLPNCAGEGGDDPSKNPWTIYKAAFVPYLVSAIQDQQKQIEELKSEIEKLKGGS